MAYYFVQYFNTPFIHTEFKQSIKDVWIPALNDFQPDILFISAGFDGHIEDEISHFMLMDNDYRWVTEQLATVAAKYAQGRIVSVLEGGYALGALGRSVAAHINGLLGN